VTPQCPGCGSTNIIQNRFGFVASSVSEWVRGPDGKTQPVIGYEAEFEAYDEEPEYGCSDCGYWKQDIVPEDVPNE
jgi:hypothetical protein